MIPSTVIIARRALSVGQYRSTSVIRSFVPIPNTTIANNINIGVRLQLYQQVNCRMLSTDGGEKAESEDQGISSKNTAPASKPPSQPTHQITRPPVTNNFTKMLQYQKQPSPHQDNRRGNNNNNNGAGGFASIAQRREGNTNTPNNLASERPSWRDGWHKSNNNRQYNNKQRRSKKKNRKPQQPELKLPTHVSTSEWVEISGTPPNTKLSDLYPSLNSIIEYELNKGILDLDSLGSLDGVDDATMKALNSVDALKTLYPEQNINGDNGNNILPLWTPSSDYFDSLQKGGGDACPIICEARIHLSYRARPMGWFLRFPNRSVVNAVLNHVRRARYSWHDLSLKEARRDWREGLWRGVYDEYEVKANEKERDMALKEEDHDEKELMWGEEFTTEEEKVVVEAAEDTEIQGDLAPETTGQEESDDNMQASDIEDYMNNYSEAFPFPRQGQSATPSASPNQLLKVASMPLKIREFLPYPSDTTIDSEHQRQPPWEQHSFHLSPTLNLSENVVRVETEDLRVNERDVRFWFRGYDTESIQLKENSDESTDNGLTPDLAEYPEKQLNWNVNGVSKDQSNVDFLIKGITQRDLKYEYKRKGTPIKSTRNTFLVRFATSSDARMAVRDQGGKPAYRGGPFISMSQYPNVFNSE